MTGLLHGIDGPTYLTHAKKDYSSSMITFKLPNLATDPSGCF
jgi:hypothetical protein